jgi:hypothetical protein
LVATLVPVPVVVELPALLAVVLLPPQPEIMSVTVLKNSIARRVNDIVILTREGG